MASNQEVEVKFRVGKLRALDRKLRAAGFRKQTPRTLEVNTLYDLPGAKLRKRKELLRLRQYGKEWKIAHKSGTRTGGHSSRQELETKVGNGKVMDAILRSLGYEPSFRYEKFRTEWSDHKGEVVVDETPVGNFAEIEGPPRWIDETARKLGVSRDQYIMKNYATLFNEWKRQTNSPAEEMTFRAIRNKKR